MNYQDLAEFYEFLNINSIDGKSYKPQKSLNWNTYREVAESNEIIQKLISSKIGAVNSEGWDVKVNISKVQSKNERLAREVIYKLKNEFKLDELINNYVSITTIYGNSYGMQNDDSSFNILEPNCLNLYYDSENRRPAYYKKIVKGIEQKSEIESSLVYHFKESSSSYKPLADSPIDWCYGWLLLYQHSLQINNNSISSGWVGSLIALFEKEMSTKLDQKDVKGERTGDKWLRSLQEKLGGAVNKLRGISQKPTTQSHKIAFLTGVKEFIELGKSNREMQLIDLINKAEQAIYRAFGETQTTENSTYSNAKTFNYQRYESIARPLQKQFENFVNQFMLPKLGINFGENLYFQFNVPTDPDLLENQKFKLEVLKNTYSLVDDSNYRIQVLNEFRDAIGLENIDNSIISKEVKKKLEDEVKANKKEDFSFKVKKTAFEHALESGHYERLEPDKNKPTKRVRKGFLPSLENALNKQFENFIEESRKSKSFGKIKKLETFYSMNTLQKDLIKFTDSALSEIKLPKIVEYPKYLSDLIETKAKLILKGDEKYTGVDSETQNQIDSLIKNNQDVEFDDLIVIFSSELPKLAIKRAEQIARPVVAEIVETSRFMVHKNNDYKVKRILNVRDNKVTQICKNNTNKGVVSIDYIYEHSTGDGLQPPFHFDCRSTAIYGKVKEDIE